jgi:hypothetical protein
MDQVQQLLTLITPAPFYNNIIYTILSKEAMDMVVMHKVGVTRNASCAVVAIPFVLLFYFNLCTGHVQIPQGVGNRSI